MRFHRWILLVAGRLVPKDTRAEWRREWDAELDHREASLRQWPTRSRHSDLIRQSLGAFWDAVWLQSSRWYSLRLFARHWRLTLSAVLSMSIALAAVVMGLSAYSALLLRAPGVAEPDRLRAIHIRTSDEPYGSASLPEYAEYRALTRTFADVAAYPFAISGLTFRIGPREEKVLAAQVSNNYFSVLGIAPEAGLLTLHSSTTDGDYDIAIGDRLWRKLGADRTIAGKSVQLNDQTVTIVGVVPTSFRGMLWAFTPDVWMSLETAAHVFGSAPTELTDRTRRSLHMVGRLKPGVTAEQAQADVLLAAAAIAREHPATDVGRSALVTPLSVTPPGERQWTVTILGALMLVVVLTLIVACTNVTNLLLGLATSRRHEMLVRAALGASRPQLVMPLVTESTWLGLVAGVLGYGLSWIALSYLATATISTGGLLPSLSLDLRPDIVVVMVTMVIALVAGVLVGLAPAVRSASEGLSGAINRELSTSEPRRTRVRNVLVVVQMAVATVVLIGVGVSVHSLVNLRNVPLGFSERHLVFADIDMRRGGYTQGTGPAFYQRLREQLVRKPGIEAITIANNAPLSGYATDRVLAESEAPGPDGRGRPTPFAIVDERYFSTLGIGLVAGRTFDTRDQTGRTEVVVVNATLARRHWPGLNPIGRRLRIDNGNRLVEVIGVVPDGKYGDIDEDQLPFMYFALAQHYLQDITIIAKSRGARDSVILAALDVDPNIVPRGAMTLDDLLGVSLLLPRVIVWTTIVFGALALTLAVFGLYSTVFYAVSQRKIEFGIRITLGAAPADLFSLVLRQSGLIALLGAALGLTAGLASLPLASSIFFGIGRIEPLVLVCVALASAVLTIATTHLVVRPWTRMAPSAVLRR